MRLPKVITIDFETDAIESRPVYPPRAVGVSIKYPGRKARYYAWGHPLENNCSKWDAENALHKAYSEANSGDIDGLLFHNAKFDIDVAETHMGMPRLSWEKYHDTMFLLFLRDPHAPDYALKPSSERLLHMPPDEQDAVRAWLVEQKIVARNNQRWGAHISKAPGLLVGSYANSDVERTEALFKLCWKEVSGRGMLGAYDTERALMPILLDNERQGIRVDVGSLERANFDYASAMATVEGWIRSKLSVSDLNIDSNEDLAEALERAGEVTEWVMTKTGKRSTSKENMQGIHFKSPELAQALGYRARLSTCMGTFLLPWLNVARETGGLIHTNWNQLRQSGSGSGTVGTRTGRMSSTPNFQNIPKDFYDKHDGYAHPDLAGAALPELPRLRDYITPDKGQIIAKRDYNQQELRVLAHFEDAALAKAYQDQPRLDVHSFVQQKIMEVMGLSVERRKVKIINFLMVYGGGLGVLSKQLGCTTDEAKQLKTAHAKALPGVAEMDKALKGMGRAGDPLVTWGGREYYCEEPVMWQGKKLTFEYKLLNYLVQGSAADMTKRAMIRYNEMKKDGRFMLSVHDELNISVPKKALKSEMKILKEAMEDIEFGVPIISDGETGACWGQLTDYKD